MNVPIHAHGLNKKSPNIAVTGLPIAYRVAAKSLELKLWAVDITNLDANLLWGHTYFLQGWNRVWAIAVPLTIVLREGNGMDTTAAAQYRAKAEECARRAQHTQDLNAQLEWQKLAASWQALAERSEKTREIVLPPAEWSGPQS